MSIIKPHHHALPPPSCSPAQSIIDHESSSPVINITSSCILHHPSSQPLIIHRDPLSSSPILPSLHYHPSYFVHLHHTSRTNYHHRHHHAKKPAFSNTPLTKPPPSSSGLDARTSHALTRVRQPSPRRRQPRPAHRSLSTRRDSPQTPQRREIPLHLHL